MKGMEIPLIGDASARTSVSGEGPKSEKGGSSGLVPDSVSKSGNEGSYMVQTNTSFHCSLFCKIIFN